MNKALKITLISLGSLIGLILVILILATLFAGSIAKNYVNNHGEELIGRRVNIDNIDLNLFNGHLALHNLDIYEDDKTTTFAGFDTLDIKLKLLKLINSTVDVNHITLAGLNVNVEQNGDVFNFTSLLDHFSSDEPKPEEPEDTTASSWIIKLHNIRLSNGDIQYSDLAKHSHWGFNDLNLAIPDFCIGGDEATNGGLNLMFADGGSLNANLGYNSSSNDFDIAIALEQFALNQALPYLTDFINTKELGGSLNLHANVKGNLSEIMKMQIDGTVALNDIDVIDGKGTSVAQCKSIDIGIDNLNLADNSYSIGDVIIDGLKTSYETYESHNSFTTLLDVPQQTADTTTQQAPADTSASTPSQPMQLLVKHFEMRNSNVTYADHTMPDDFVFPINKLNIKADNITLNGDNSASIYAALPSGGYATIRWQGNISNWKKHQHLNLRIKDLHLTDLSPYLVAYLGQPFTDGTFSFVSDNRINNSELQGQNQVDIYKATVGKRRKDVKAEMHLPLKAALYVLKDKDDKILLDVPISGNIDKPEFNYIKLVWKTLGQLVVKVATSPVRALGNAISGGNDDGTVFIAIDTAARDFTSEQYYQIDKISEMAKNDESIIVTFNQQTYPAIDSLPLPQHVEIRNNILRHHLNSLGINESQIVINTTPVAGLKKPGYSISTSIKEMELPQE